MEFSQELQADALARLNENYCKMLFVNFSTGSVVPARVPDDEADFLEAGPVSISDYWAWFAAGPLLHDEDREKFTAFLATADAGSAVVYRRKLGEGYRWVHLELVRAKCYTPQNRECVLFVRDIDATYRREYDAAVEPIRYVDGFTKLYNKLAFERDCSRFSGPVVGVVYADLNGLKKTNDEKGHQAGDELILKLAALLGFGFGGCRCYHLSGDEFAVLSWECNVREFLAKAIAFHKSMWTAMEVPLASMGYSVGLAAELDLVVSEAEKEMYDDKRMFYSRFPEFKRK